MSTAHGPHRQDGEQNPNNEQPQAPNSEQAPNSDHTPNSDQAQPSYYADQAGHGQEDAGRMAPGGQPAYGDQGPYGGQAAYWNQAPYGGQAAYGDQAPYGSQAPYGAPGQYGAPPPPPPPAIWPAAAMPGGHGGPAHAAGHKRRSRRVMAVAGGLAAVALAAGGTTWAMAGSGSSTLTTSQIASQTDPGLVDVISTLGYQHGTAEGTGMVLTPNGEILTNNHVVAGSTSIKVRDIGNGQTYTARVVGYSQSNDVAVLQATGASGLSTVKIGNSGGAAVGQQVVALGNAGGKDGTPSVATGKVTALGASVTAQDQGAGTVEHLTDMISTDANIQPGDSGGPLLNTKGDVIGMDTAASTGNSGGFGTTAEVSTTAFSIPINNALAIVSQIETGHGSATVHIGTTAFLGVQIASASAGGFGQAGSGVLIAGVVNGTAAATAGVANGDTLLSVGGQQVTGSSLQSLIAGYHPGDKVSITWSDGLGQTHTATVTLTAGPTG